MRTYNNLPTTFTSRYYLFKAEPHTTDYWYECESDDYGFINERALEVQGWCGGLWVEILTLDELCAKATQG